MLYTIDMLAISAIMFTYGMLNVQFCYDSKIIITNCIGNPFICNSTFNADCILVNIMVLNYTSLYSIIKQLTNQRYYHIFFF